MSEYTAHDSRTARFAAADGGYYRCTRRGKGRDGRWYMKGDLYDPRNARFVQQPQPLLSLYGGVEAKP